MTDAPSEGNGPDALRAQLVEMLRDREGLSAYLSNAAHQMKTPLTVLKTYIELVQAEVFGQVPTEMMDKLSIMEVNLDELSYFVDQLQDMSLLSAGSVKMHNGTVDLVEVSEKVINEVIPSARSRGVGLMIEGTDGQVLARMDQSLTRKAFLHLMRYVILTAPREAEITIALKKGPEKVLLVVFGFGELIETSEMARILEGMSERETNLTTVDWEKLSLPLCKALMEAQGGGLTIFNDENDRTLYVLEFQTG